MKCGVCMFEFVFNDYVVNKYRFIGEFHDGLACVQNNRGLWGFIDETFNEVIPCKFNEAMDFSGGVAEVCYYKKRLVDIDGIWETKRYWFNIDKKGFQLTTPQLKEACKYGNVCNTDKKRNNEIVEPVIYCSVLEIDCVKFFPYKHKGLTVSIEAETEEKLNEKKFVILKKAHEIINCAMIEELNKIKNEIDEMAYSIPLTTKQLKLKN